ncbi:MAG: PcfJ domain-containing protein [Alphaproteobacteria bacterium]|nr:PcfJ domain-containing protein [Alphaproteobacteria bacterium]
MPVNLINEKALNEYLSDVVYHGQQMDSFSKGEFNSPEYVVQNKDAIVRSMVMQWMKHRLRSYLTEDNTEKGDFLQIVRKEEENLPAWAERCMAEGKTVHRFVADKIPANLTENISKVRDYLYSAAESYVNKTIARAKETEQKPRLRIDYLKASNEWDSFAKTLHSAEKWHELMAKKAEQKAHDEKMYKESLAGTQRVMKLDGGMEIVQLTTEKALDFESEYMGHCVGKGGYDEGVRRGSIKIYSLRDENGEPHATFEVRVNPESGKEEVHQCKGKGNKAPVAKYRGYVQAFVKAQEFEIIGDMANVGLIKQYDEKTKKEEYYDIYHLPKGFVVEGNLDFSGQGLSELPDLSEVIVKGNFDCFENQLTSLEGVPQKVGRDFDCGRNQLTSLAGAPQKVGGHFKCSENQLTSLEGAPQKVGGGFVCVYNQLTSLAGAPQEVGGDFVCYQNQLTSLAGAPQKVGGGFYCAGNQLTSLAGAPQKVGGDFTCDGNQLTSLAGAPQKVGGGFYCDHNQLTSLAGAPQKVGGGFYCNGDVVTRYGLTAIEWDYARVREAIQRKENAEKIATLREKMEKTVPAEKGKKSRSVGELLKKAKQFFQRS